MRKKVSLIVPIYNAQKYLPMTLYTMLEQDYSNIEIVAVNDASTDATEELLNEFREKFESKGFSYIIVNCVRNGGLCAAINEGLKVATGNFLCFPDADDELCSNYVSSMLHVLEHNPSLGWVRCNYSIVLEEENREYDVILPGKSVYKNDFYDFVSKFVPHNAWNMMVKREYFEKCIGKQILDSRLTQEWSLLFPLSYYSDYARCEKVLYRYHIRKGAMSSWQNGKIDDVIKHFDDLKLLNLEVLNKINVNSDDFSLAKKTLEIYYALAKMKKYKAKNYEKEYQSEKNYLYELCTDIISRKNAEIMDNHDLYVRLILDSLLKMRADIPVEYYKKYKEMFSGGYKVYTDKGGKKLLTSIRAAFGRPHEVIDIEDEKHFDKSDHLPTACLLENSRYFFQLVEKNPEQKHLYIDYRILRDAVRGWAYIKGWKSIEYEME